MSTWEHGAPEVKEIQPLTSGEYTVYLLEANPTTSTTGNPMLKMKLCAFNPAEPHGNRWIMDNLVKTENSAYRIKSFHEAFGMPYEAQLDYGALIATKRTARVLVGVESYVDSSGVPKQKNTIIKYLPPNGNNVVITDAQAIPNFEPVF